MKLAILAVLLLAVSACSVKFELGYHGETGRQDTTASQLKNGK